MPASGFAGLFGLFAGCCALFAACVTISDWKYETTERSWPQLAAVVDRAEVIVSSSGGKDGDKTTTTLRYRVRYQADGKERSATLTSRSVFSDTEALRLQSWAIQHHKGTQIDIRYDPSQQGRAAFASPEVSDAMSRVGTDVLLLIISALAAAGLLALAKYLRWKEASAVTTDQSGGGIAIGVATAAIGLMYVGLILNAVLQATTPVTADSLMGLPAALMFVFAGILLMLPPGSAKWQRLLVALLITCFAITFDWIAFGPGERQFSGGLSLGIAGIGFNPGEWFGRIAFGVFAVILDIIAIAMWVTEFRRPK